MAFCGVLILSTGCIPSLHPLYTEEDLVFEPGLIGQWTEDDSKEIWVFSKVNSDEYKLVHTDKDGIHGTFSAHLLKIKGNMFLDLFPEINGSSKKENSFYKFHFYPVHTFLYVKQIEPTLQMCFPNPEWIEKLIEENPKAIRHEVVEDDVIILTAGTKELQAFWLKHFETKEAFCDDPTNMKRKQLTVPKEPTTGIPSLVQAQTDALDKLFGSELKTAAKKSVSADKLSDKIIGVYFSAHWCPPCRTFTPKLVEFYNSLNKQGKPFELVFVSSDRDESSMYKYMEEMHMPWLALPYGDKHIKDLKNKFNVRGIPKLVILNSSLDLITENARADVTSSGTSAFDKWQTSNATPMDCKGKCEKQGNN